MLVLGTNVEQGSIKMILCYVLRLFYVYLTQGCNYVLSFPVTLFDRMILSA